MPAQPQGILTAHANMFALQLQRGIPIGGHFGLPFWHTLYFCRVTTTRNANRRKRWHHDISRVMAASFATRDGKVCIMATLGWLYWSYILPVLLYIIGLNPKSHFWLPVNLKSDQVQYTHIHVCYLGVCHILNSLHIGSSVLSSPCACLFTSRH